MGIFDTIFGPPNVRKLKDKKNIKGLIKALRAKDKYIRIEATKALGEISGPMTVEPLIQALKDEDDGVRGTATKALGKIKDPSVVEPLIQVLEDENIVNRWYAMESLGAVGDARAVTPLMHNILEDKASIALEKIGKSAVEPLAQALKDKNSSVRKRAAAILGTIRDHRAVEPLVEALDDVDVFVRCTVATNLGRIGDERAVGPLINALKDEDGRVRIDSERALEKIGEPAVEKLNQALEDENASVREIAKRLLEKLVKSEFKEQKETENIKSQIKSILRNLPVIGEEYISECRRKMVNQSKSIHPSMFSGSTNEVIDFVARMAQETESFILSCEGITKVKKVFAISIWPIGEEVLEIQYEKFWNDGNSSIYSEHVMRIGDDKFEVFGSEKSAARMASVWTDGGFRKQS